MSDNGGGKVVVRVATVADVPLILSFIKGLAEYEKLLHEVEATEADIRRDLFGENPRCFCDIAEHEGQPVGFALWFYSYSTFRGRAGAGKALLSRLAQRCVDADLGRLEWWVLDWNKPAIEFYDSLDAQAMSDWTVRRVDGEALKRLAQA